MGHCGPELPRWEILKIGGPDEVFTIQKTGIGWGRDDGGSASDVGATTEPSHDEIFPKGITRVVPRFTRGFIFTHFQVIYLALCSFDYDG